MKLDVIGVHPVGAPESVHLIELRVTALDGSFDVGEITQELPGQPRDNWQAAYDEHFLSADGTSVLDPSWPDQPPEDTALRLVFFFHYFDSTKPLLTPAGSVPMPTETERPERLRFMDYESPC